MSFEIEKKENKVYITYKNLDYEIEPILINVEIEVKKFEECVQKFKEKGIINPELQAIISFVFYGGCVEY
jgi:hypothetical protein